MQRIYNATDIIEANIIKGLLEQFNIPSYVSGFYLQGGVGEIPPSGNSSIWVEEKYLERAKSVINHYESG